MRQLEGCETGMGGKFRVGLYQESPPDPLLITMLMYVIKKMCGRRHQGPCFWRTALQSVKREKRP